LFFLAFCGVIYQNLLHGRVYTAVSSQKLLFRQFCEKPLHITFKVKFWSNVTPRVLMVSEKGMGMPAIVGDATGGKVCRRWRVPITAHHCQTL